MALVLLLPFVAEWRISKSESDYFLLTLAMFIVQTQEKQGRHPRMLCHKEAHTT